MSNKQFKEIELSSLSFNPFDKIGKEWLLITAGNDKEIGTMTASWGGVGTMWNKPAVFIFIRPQRYTKKFVDSEELFSISFYDKEYREKLAYLGSHSQKNEDKITAVDFHKTTLDNCPVFEEANLVLICKKAYSQNLLKERFLNEEYVDTFYKDNDFHEMYVGLIEKAYVRE